MHGSQLISRWEAEEAGIPILDGRAHFSSVTHSNSVIIITPHTLLFLLWICTVLPVALRGNIFCRWMSTCKSMSGLVAIKDFVHSLMSNNFTYYEYNNQQENTVSTMMDVGFWAVNWFSLRVICNVENL